MRRAVPVLPAVFALTLTMGACTDGRPSAGVAGSDVPAEMATTSVYSLGTADGMSPGGGTTPTKPTVDPPPQLTTPPTSADTAPPSVLPPSTYVEQAPPLHTPPPTLADFELATLEAAEIGYLTDLAAINPALAADEKRALNRAANTCQELGAGKEFSVVISNTAKRFDGSVSVDNELGRQIVAVIEHNLCPVAPGQS